MEDGVGRGYNIGGNTYIMSALVFVQVLAQRYVYSIPVLPYGYPPVDFLCTLSEEGFF